MTNTQITYLVGAGCGVLALAVFVTLVLAPALGSYRRVWEKVAVVIVSGYVLAALVGVGVVLGAVIVLEWPRFF